MSMTGRRGVLVAAALLLGGCETLGSKLPPVPPPDLRVVVTTAVEYPSEAEAGMRISNLARVPVRDVDTLGGGRYRLVLVCPDIATCRAAAQRIANDRIFALGVDAENPNSRQTIPVKPTREASR
ncbi:MAG TPA: hypothetical protein VFZ28_05545 [Burkholderiaceae bacterium]|nr:hypothetical protein [Burkholderiaceae bacterium]